MTVDIMGDEGPTVGLNSKRKSVAMIDSFKVMIAAREGARQYDLTIAEIAGSID